MLLSSVAVTAAPCSRRPSSTVRPARVRRSLPAPNPETPIQRRAPLPNTGSGRRLRGQMRAPYVHPFERACDPSAPLPWGLRGTSTSQGGRLVVRSEKKSQRMGYVSEDNSVRFPPYASVSPVTISHHRHHS